ncbi:MAG: D-isomer specific 2-hydroxyacid dehydrogenase family protein [Patescibacteria group bacterium]
MKGKILVTDSLFIFDEHVKILEGSGYEVERLDKPDASEEELVQAIQGKTGYILGGIEKVTEKVIDAADELKVIVFTGADARAFIPGFEKAKEKGITIVNAPGANSYAVAEYTLTLILAMTRNIFELGRTGEKKFQTTKSLKDLAVGIVGMGNIGSLMAENLHSLGVKEILYFSRSRQLEIEAKTGAKFVTLEELLSQCDIVTLHASKEAGDGFIGKEELVKMKDGSLLVNCGFTGGVDADALFEELQTGRLRAAQDDPMDKRFNTLPLSTWFHSNSHTAYNTNEANKRASDMATQSLLNILETGEDQYIL